MVTTGVIQALSPELRTLPSRPAALIADLPRPGRFGERSGPKASPASAWSVVADGPTSIQTIPLGGATEPELIPGYFAIMWPRHG